MPLLLLDSDVHEQRRGRPQRHRAASTAAAASTRLQQEMLLGMGGVRALRLWSRLTGAPTPDVYHTNEGHAGFLGVERISELVRADGMTFDEALEAVRAATVFTTHTPVPAGIDRFDAALDRAATSAARRPSRACPSSGCSQLGAETYEGGEPGMFNMAVMGLRLAQRANGVSQLHGVVSREMFDGLWPGFDDAEVPITSHHQRRARARPGSTARSSSWPASTSDRRRSTRQDAWEAHRRRARATPSGRTKREMRAAARRRRPGAAPRPSWHEARRLRRPSSAGSTTILDPDVLTIGFARRVPTYKRLTLMLRDPERLKQLLLHPTRPIQLVIAGKSHPADETGKQLIQQLVQFADDPEVRHRIVFLPNYDIAMAQHLYPGCDVWLNNPLRPFEACGTSGMKAALNGALNLSILDGWWDEWYDGKNGWAIPTADGVEDPERRDDIEASALYDLVENQVAPRFYDTRRDGLPQNWLAMMLHTLTTLGPEGAGQPDGARLHREALRARRPRRAGR